MLPNRSIKREVLLILRDREIGERYGPQRDRFGDLTHQSTRRELRRAEPHVRQAADGDGDMRESRVAVVSREESLPGHFGGQDDT